MTKDKRTLKDLNLMDKFLFDEAMEDKDNMKTLLDIVLGQDTHLKYPRGVVPRALAHNHRPDARHKQKKSSEILKKIAR